MYTRFELKDAMHDCINVLTEVYFKKREPGIHFNKKRWLRIIRH